MGIRRRRRCSPAVEFVDDTPTPLDAFDNRNQRSPARLGRRNRPHGVRDGGTGPQLASEELESERKSGPIVAPSTPPKGRRTRSGTDRDGRPGNRAAEHAHTPDERHDRNQEVHRTPHCRSVDPSAWTAAISTTRRADP
jgi:hypothetical protein